MRVLYVNHTAQVSGAEHSLLVMLRALGGAVTPFVACPEGPLAAAVREAGFPVCPIPGTDLSAQLHPLYTVRETAKVGDAAVAIRRIARRVGAEIVHANGARAGLMAIAARGRDRPGPLVHVRDGVPPGRLPRAMFSLLATQASGFIPTSRYLAAQLPPGARTHIVANAIEPERFDPAGVDRAAVREALGLPAASPVIAVVGQISPHKGQSDAIEALALVRRDHPDARLLVIGSVKFSSGATRFDNAAYDAELRGLAARRQLGEAVAFLGERHDIAGILGAVDVLLVPSWYEPFGRVVLEGMMMRVPVIATAVGGSAEVLRDGRDGRVLPPRRPELWAEATSGLLADPARRTAMGESGRERALRDFSPESHRRDLLAVYELLRAAPARRYAAR